MLNGIQRLKRAFSRGQYLITREVWDAGERATGNSIRKAQSTLMVGIIKSSRKKTDERTHLTRSGMTASHGTGQTLWLITDNTQLEPPLIEE